MHAQVYHSVVKRMHLHVVRVATDDNIADLPSRRVRMHIAFSKSLACALRNSAFCGIWERAKWNLS